MNEPADIELQPYYLRAIARDLGRTSNRIVSDLLCKVADEVESLRAVIERLSSAPAKDDEGSLRLATQTQSELLPCPFCGCAALIENLTPATVRPNDPPYWFISCGDGGCGVPSSEDHDRDAAIAAWNKRAPDTRGEANPSPGADTEAIEAARSIIKLLTPVHPIKRSVIEEYAYEVARAYLARQEGAREAVKQSKLERAVDVPYVATIIERALKIGHLPVDGTDRVILSDFLYHARSLGARKEP